MNAEPAALPAALPAGGAPFDMLDLLARPEGVAVPIVDLHEVVPPMRAFLRHEASLQPDLAPRVEAFADSLRTRLRERRLALAPGPGAPVRTTRYATPHGELAFFSEPVRPAPEGGVPPERPRIAGSGAACRGRDSGQTWGLARKRRARRSRRAF